MQEPIRAETILYLIVGSEANITNCEQFVTFCVAAFGAFCESEEPSLALYHCRSEENPPMPIKWQMQILHVLNQN